MNERTNTGTTKYE